MATFDIPPWLQQPADPLRAIAVGAQVGAQLAATRQRAQELKLRQAAQEQDAQMQTLKMREFLRVRDQQIEAEFAMQEISDTVSPLLEAGKDLEAYEAMLSFSSRKPAVLNSARWGTLAQEIRGAASLRQQREQLAQQKALQASQIYENRAQAELDLAEATDMQLGVGSSGIETFSITDPRTGEPTGEVAVRVPGSKALHISKPQGLSRQSEIEYRELVRALGSIDRELAKNPFRPGGKDAKGEKVQPLSDERIELLKQRRRVTEQLEGFNRPSAGTVAPASAVAPATPATPQGGIPVSPAPATPAIPPRPPGVSDADILREAAEAKAQGRDPLWLRRTLDSWGVKGEF